MATITASEVNRLRKQTGSGMMDCKNALVEAEGDFNKAIDFLRKKGQKVAAKRGDRETSEGLAIAKATDDAKRGVILTISCETDFVAKNDDFNQFANQIVDVAIANNVSTVEELQALSYNSNGQTVAEKILEEIGKIGEKIEISTFSKLESDKVIAYNHPGNQVASMVALNKDSEAATEAGRDVAMQVAAMAPVALDKDSVDQSVIDKEIEIGKELAIQEGKPAALAEKIAAGKLNKFFKDNTLLNQGFIKENKQSVAQYLDSKEKGLTVTEFKRASLA